MTVIKNQCQSLFKVCPEEFKFKFQNHRAFQLALMSTLKGSGTTELIICISDHLCLQSLNVGQCKVIFALGHSNKLITQILLSELLSQNVIIDS